MFTCLHTWAPRPPPPPSQLALPTPRIPIPRPNSNSDRRSTQNIQPPPNLPTDLQSTALMNFLRRQWRPNWAGETFIKLGVLASDVGALKSPPGTAISAGPSGVRQMESLLRRAEDHRPLFFSFSVFISLRCPLPVRALSQIVNLVTCSYCVIRIQ